MKPTWTPGREGSLAALLIAGCSTGSNANTAPLDASADAPLACAPTDDGDCTIGPAYADAPELTVRPGVPRGMIAHFTMASSDSKIFPGVTGPYTRDVWVYVPSQYVDGSEAALLVVQDGAHYTDRVAAALDTMIDAKTLPAIVGVFVNPGPGDGRGSERGYEYDTVSTDYTTFIETEVLPLVPANADVQAKYKNLKLTKNPEGRASMGGSSGGAAAFTMGWFRPDLYHRILAYSGTFVNQHPDANYPHGAWEYHEHLIAGAPAKPLRVFLEVGGGDLDLEILFHDGMHSWPTANKAMAAALKAQGYHYRFDYALGAGHVDDTVIGQTLPEALRWLWRGYT